MNAGREVDSGCLTCQWHADWLATPDGADVRTLRLTPRWKTQKRSFQLRRPKSDVPPPFLRRYPRWLA